MTCLSPRAHKCTAVAEAELGEAAGVWGVRAAGGGGGAGHGALGLHTLTMPGAGFAEQWP